MDLVDVVSQLARRTRALENLRIPPARQPRAGAPITVTDTYDVTARDWVIFADATTVNPLKISLPAAASHLGWEYVVKKIDAVNNVEIYPAGADTIDGGASFVLATQWESVTVVSDGASDWRVTAKYL